MQQNEAFITTKDHKEGFPHHVSCRLLNTSENNIGRISKVLLDKINSAVLSSTKINQWKNTSSVIAWFDQITHKQISSFICFDVENFYPSISSNLLKESVNLQDSLSRFLIMIYQSLCRLGKPFFLKVQDPG